MNHVSLTFWDSVVWSESSSLHISLFVKFIALYFLFCQTWLLYLLKRQRMRKWEKMLHWCLLISYANGSEWTGSLYIGPFISIYVYFLITELNCSLPLYQLKDDSMRWVAGFLYVIFFFGGLTILEIVQSGAGLGGIAHFSKHINFKF